MATEENPAPKPKTEMSILKTKKTSGSGHRVKINAPYAYVEELVISSPSERNWRGIFIALLVIVAVLGLIVFSIVLVSPPEEGPRVKGRKPTLEDIFLKLPVPPRFNATWVSDTEFVYQDSSGSITLFNAVNATSKLLMTNSTFRQYNSMDFKISKDLKMLLLISDITNVNEHTFLARYFVYERLTRNKRPLSPEDTDEEAPLLQYASWAPDGNAVVFVHGNDIYYKPKVRKDLVCRITKTGSRDVYNGIPDWLYETEILKTSHAVWFSPDGQYLMYMTFNDTLVEEYQYTWYDVHNPLANYPSVRSVKYPKVESHNPEVTVSIVNLSKPKYLFPMELKPTSSVEFGSYVTSATFFGDNNVAIVWLNRLQNISVVATCRSKDNFNCTDFHIERESREPIIHPVFASDGAHALVRLPVQDGDNGHYMHACQLSANAVLPLTHGAFELSDILAWDEENHLIYAIATMENHPGVRHLFKIGDTNSSQPWTCMTCQPKLDYNLTFISDSEIINETVLNTTLLSHYVCEYNNVIFSNSFRFYVQECLGPEVPVVFLVDTASNSRLAVLDYATVLRNRVRSLSPPQFKNIQVEIEYGYKAQVRLFLPSVLREYEDVTFPMILILDSRPGEQMVSSEWHLGWPWYLASTRNYIVAQIDARGSGFQGEQLHREIQNRIGTVDVQDQLAVVTYLRDTFKYIDRTKICVVGYGYGGYLSAMMLLEDFNQVLNCSVSVSPITNWRYYNSYFAEKYMGLPSADTQVYDSADLTLRAGNLYNRQYLLVHGTADILVTAQHSMLFAKALIEQGVLFRQLVYPDEKHEFSKTTLLHMYREIDQFFNDSFGPVIDDWDDGALFFIQ